MSGDNSLRNAMGQVIPEVLKKIYDMGYLVRDVHVDDVDKVISIEIDCGAEGRRTPRAMKGRTPIGGIPDEH